MSFEIVKTKRDKEKFIENGHMCTFDRFSADMTRKFWRCASKKIFAKHEFTRIY